MSHLIQVTVSRNLEDLLDDGSEREEVFPGKEVAESSPGPVEHLVTWSLHEVAVDCAEHLLVHPDISVCCLQTRG